MKEKENIIPKQTWLDILKSKQTWLDILNLPEFKQKGPRKGLALLAFFILVSAWRTSGAVVEQEFMLRFSIMAIITLSLMLHFNSYPGLEKLSTTQLSIIFTLLSSLYLVLFLNSSLQGFLLQKIKIASGFLIFSKQNAKFYSVRYIVSLTVSFSACYTLSKNVLSYFMHNRLATTVWPTIGFYYIVLLGIDLQKNNLSAYFSLLAPGVLLILPLLIWIRMGFVLLSRNAYFRHKFGNYYKR